MTESRPPGSTSAPPGGGMTLGTLVAHLARRLPLTWLAGEASRAHSLELGEIRRQDISLLGHFSLTRPNVIQVLGEVEAAYLRNLTTSERTRRLDQLLSPHTRLVLLTDSLAPPEALVTRCAEAGIGLLRTPVPSFEAMTELRDLLAEQLAEQTTLHGVFMEVVGSGVLISGRSAIGKSELALELISRGHRLIADDAPLFTRIAPNTLRGSCPPLLQDFLEVRGLGVLNIRAMFGDSAIKPVKNLRLIVHLVPPEEAGEPEQHHLTGLHAPQTILGVEIPRILLPVAPGRNLAVLVEAAVRNHLLQANGYHAALDFQARLRQQLEHDTQ